MNRKQRRAREKTAGKSPQATPPGKPAADPAALYEAGIEAYRAGHLAAAADLIGQAIAAGGAQPELHYNLAIVLRAMDRPQDAAASYERAIALKPDYVNAHNNLGNVWKALGRADQARASFAQALRYNPGNADTHYSLGVLCCDEGDRGAAELHFRHCLEQDPDDHLGARILLAHLGAGAAPDRTPQAHLQSLYETRSRFWDQEGGYLGARLVADAFRRHAPPAKADILDIGCGTGLVGEAVRDLAARLDGVDLSSAMLEKAKAKAVYDGLFQADLASFLADHMDSHDAILAAATLIHFGDLSALFQGVSRSLRDGGLFVFTVFPHEGSGEHAAAASARLAQSGCYQHSASYLEQLAAETGFVALEMQKTVHEHDQAGNPVAGILAVLRKS